MEVSVSSVHGVTAKCLDCGASKSFPGERQPALAAASQWCWGHACKPKEIGRPSAPVIEGEVVEDERYPKPLQRRLGMTDGD
jgi:hypothetical protein